MDTEKARIDHATRECHRANERLLSASGCLYLALDELRPVARLSEDPTVQTLVKTLTSIQDAVDALAKRTEAAWSTLYELGAR